MTSDFSREYPHSFGEALRVCGEILSRNRELLRKGWVETESEQLVIGAHRISTGERLSRAEFFARLGDRIPERSAERLLILAGRRAEGVPLQHLLGVQIFLDHEYEVSPAVLVPRPETEVLVREALSELKSPALGIEVGLGSGIISIELLHAFSSLRMVASEISADAAQLAGKNASRILGETGATRLEILRPSSPDEILEPFRGMKADFLISNPPYLDPASSDEVEREVLAHEPHDALFPSNGDPLYFYRALAVQAGELLNLRGKIFLEIAAERAETTRALFESNWRAKIIQDLAGRPRVLIAEKK